MLKKPCKVLLSFFSLFLLTGAIFSLSKVDAASPNRAIIDLPASGSTYYNSDVEVYGWALNTSGISRVDIYLDNTFMGSVTSLYNRSDVQRAFAGYGYANIANSGFCFTISKNNISTGGHRINVAAIGNDGSVTWVGANITEAKAPARAIIDSPSQNTNYSNSGFTLYGWGLNASGVQRVDIYLDGSFVTTTYTNLSRTDVANAFSAYNYPGASTSGFSCYIPKNMLSTGTHTIYAAVIGNDGSVQWVGSKFYENKPVQRSNIDAPTGRSSYNNGDIAISGWALAAGGINRVDVYIDNSFRTSITSFYNRTDVQSAFAGYGYDNIDSSGFCYVIAADSIAPGSHTLSMAVIGNDGTVQWYGSTVTEIKASPRLYIDSPSNNQNYSNTENVTIYGWALNASGISAVSVDMDGSGITYTTSLAYDSTVNSSQNSSGNYHNGLYNRFSFLISTDIISLGTHTFTIRCVGNDGTSESININFTKNVATYSHFNISLSTMQAKNPSATSDQLNPSVLMCSSVDVYQFLNLKWTGSSNITVSKLNAILSGQGTLDGQGQAFMDAANTYHINPVYLICHAIWETGHGTSRLATGTVDGYTGYYNMYGIGARDDTETNPVILGAKFAKDTAQNWDTPYKAIVGGAGWIALHYIDSVHQATDGNPNHYDQPTLYEMLFDPYGWSVYNSGHKYASDSSWAHGIAGLINQYSYIFGDDKLTFTFVSYRS